MTSDVAFQARRAAEQALAAVWGPFPWYIPFSNETPLTVATNKVLTRAPFAMDLTGLLPRAFMSVGPVGSAVVLDINVGGSTILSTKLSIDDGDKTSVGSAAPPVLGTTYIADNAEVTIDCVAVGSMGTEGDGGTIIIYYRRAS